MGCIGISLPVVPSAPAFGLQPPLVGNEAPDFMAQAVFDQEFVEVTLSQYRVSAACQTATCCSVHMLLGLHACSCPDACPAATECAFPGLAHPRASWQVPAGAHQERTSWRWEH